MRQRSGTRARHLTISSRCVLPRAAVVYQPMSLLEEAIRTLLEEAIRTFGWGQWSTPTIDEKLGALYIATGDNYSDPPTETSDAIVAMDLKTGKLLWPALRTP